MTLKYSFSKWPQVNFMKDHFTYDKRFKIVELILTKYTEENEKDGVSSV